MKVRAQALKGNFPQYETAGACAFDFASLETHTFSPGEFKLVETGIIIEVPQGYALQIHPRSSTFKKYGLILANGVGIVDNDYCGPTDSIKMAFVNMSGKEVTIEAGTRLGQGMFVAIGVAEFQEADFSKNADRGGFGSTGN